MKGLLIKDAELLAKYMDIALHADSVALASQAYFFLRDVKQSMLDNEDFEEMRDLLVVEKANGIHIPVVWQGKEIEA